MIFAKVKTTVCSVYSMRGSSHTIICFEVLGSNGAPGEAVTAASGDDVDSNGNGDKTLWNARPRARKYTFAHF